LGWTCGFYGVREEPSAIVTSPPEDHGPQIEDLQKLRHDLLHYTYRNEQIARAQALGFPVTQKRPRQKDIFDWVEAQIEEHSRRWT
jgi:hypothetical protein